MGMAENAAFAQQFAALGVELPRGAADALAAWTALFEDVQLTDPVGPLRAAIQAGEIGADDIVEAVQKAAVAMNAADRLAPLRQACDQPLTLRFVESMQASVDPIIAQLREPFDEAVDHLVAGAAVIPSDADPANILALGLPDVGKMWAALGQAGVTLGQIAKGRIDLATRYGFQHNGPMVCAFIAPVATPERLREAAALFEGHLPHTQGGVWRRLVDHGFTLRLNTLAEAMSTAACSPIPDVEFAA